MTIPDKPPLPSFDPDFAGPSEWAAMYRAVGWPVVPAWLPREHKSYKRPKLTQWTAYRAAAIPQADHDRWYGPDGEHVSRENMGTITGGPHRLLMIDLDTYKSGKAEAWWREVLEFENNRIEPETVRQRTGGGGLQLFFLVPSDWRCPNAATDIGVDIRCDGGFTMLPPSLHEKGRYAWLPGFAPWEVPIAKAEPWLLDAVEALIEAHGGEIKGSKSYGQNPTGNGTGFVHASPGDEFNAFGRRTDRREYAMFRHVWHAVLEWMREGEHNRPVPFPADWEARDREAYADYERKTDTLAQGRERGWKEYWGKWRATLRRWGSPRMVEEAAKPAPEKKEDTFKAPPEEPKVDPVTGKPLPLLLTAEQFVAGFTPPAYTIDGILQRGYLYSLTARTGDGKTAVTMYIGQCVARSEAMHGCPVKGGTVLLLAGENPDDIRARYLVLAATYKFDPERIKMRFIAGIIHLPSRMDQIRAEAADIPDLMLVIVDTAAAYFPGDETNSNSQQGAYARMLRELTFLPGKPTVLVNCHPIKNAARDNLIPMGGSAFLNEIDGNLTLWSVSEKQVSLHWQGKFRGPEFEPMAFELIVETSDRVADAEGRLMPSIVAKPISDAVMEQAAGAAEDDENKLLRAIFANPAASFSALARKLGFVFNGAPQKYKIQRIINRLLGDKMVNRHRGGKYRLTEKGEREIGVKKDE
jgi:hypothetical protein